jgi:AcrR family transcriptional regulator
MPQVVFVTESNLEGVGFPLEAELEPRAPGGVTPAPSAVADRAARIVAVAREIINETGDFDLPMRTLATRAQVSLRTPYQLFASKSGVIGAVLLADQQAFRQETLQLRSTDELENLIDRVEIGIKFFSRNQPFYRALYRATQAYTPGHTEEPAREVSRSFQILSRRASQAGLLRSEIDPVMMGETISSPPTYRPGPATPSISTWSICELDSVLRSCSQARPPSLQPSACAAASWSFKKR